MDEWRCTSVGCPHILQPLIGGCQPGASCQHFRGALACHKISVSGSLDGSSLPTKFAYSCLLRDSLSHPDMAGGSGSIPCSCALGYVSKGLRSHELLAVLPRRPLARVRMRSSVKAEASKELSKAHTGIHQQACCIRPPAHERMFVDVAGAFGMLRAAEPQT